MNPVSVVVISKDEEKNIGRCLQSVSWADEIVVVDGGSTDRTLDIAREFNAIIINRSWSGYGPAKQQGVNRATSDWILSIDADEEVSPKLRDEIKDVVNLDGDVAGYYIRRKTLFLGRWIKHCGWYPDYILRLFRKSRGDFNDAVVHEKVCVNGRLKHLESELLHYSYPTLEDYFRKFNWYTTLGAEEAYKKGVRAGWFDIVIKPILSFISHYVLRQGFRDGLEGFMVSALSAVAVLAKYGKLREIHRNDKNAKE
ncbi:MAG: glycosyltransferase family 2 protein [Candidatus Zixiibacteriota bacterium]|nr:MAG: glycosyltransferase family 2 protein [candidate division Zixibacteria bacterium]